MSTVKFKFSIGDRVKDVLTDLEGTVVTQAHYLSGCNHYGIQPNAIKDGALVNPQHVDENRLVKAKKVKLSKSPKGHNGGPSENPPSIG
jgi:hypothetical protein